ncbi:MAG: DEAD/DEAH box helicase [Bacteroidota bacterium]|nr:DEAD/DEAH box helicase [Bacteroidota bacterium]
MAEKKIPYHYKPEDLTLEQWQTGLREQYAKEQKLEFKNIGDHPVYSDFEVSNPATNNTYKVSIRDGIESYNFCSCPDFRVNDLGTCKHIEFMLHYFSKYKKYRKYLTNPSSPDHSSLSIRYGSVRNIRLRKANNVARFTDEEQFFDDYGFLIPEMIDQIDTFINAAKRTDPEIIIYPDVIEYIENHKKRKHDRLTAQRLFSKETNSKVFDTLINGQLYDYQKEGVKKIVEEGRILLADDMGLGKTIQAIAATELFVAYFQVRRVLIICPTSLKYQWKREIEKFADRDSIIVEGPIHERKDMYNDASLYKIISYGICRNDLDMINAMDPDLVIIDEAQRIKNWKTKTAQAVKKIKSEYAIVLTGTPLENKIDELHSIVEFIDMYKLGPLFRFLNNHQILDEKGKLSGYKNLRTINETLKDILLRRTKKEIIDQLPGRIDKNFYVELTKEQERDHDSYYDTVCQLVNKWIYQRMLSESDRELLLMSLNCMRMVCDSTYILNKKTNSGNKINEVTELLGELLQNDENKIVIFSQWKRMFELQIKELDKNKIPFVYLNGDISARQRKVIMDLFQNNNEIKIFLSTDAGGVGVNLQSANILINLDLPWNPAVLEQRIGRIYRLGQKQHISVFNFIAKKSIEHRILYLLDFKKSVFKGVIEEEGEDSVKLESFLDSVKALTDVNLDVKNDNNYETGSNIRKQDEEFAEESNTRVLENNTGYQQGMNTVNSHESPLEEPNKVEKPGFLTRIKIRLRKLFKRWR